MARMVRLVVPSFPHHITQRGDRRQRTFFNDSDYAYNIDPMAEFSRLAQTEIWAYCLREPAVRGQRGVRFEAGIANGDVVGPEETWPCGPRAS